MEDRRVQPWYAKPEVWVIVLLTVLGWNTGVTTYVVTIGNRSAGNEVRIANLESDGSRRNDALGLRLATIEARLAGIEATNNAQVKLLGDMNANMHRHGN